MKIEFFIIDNKLSDDARTVDQVGEDLITKWNSTFQSRQKIFKRATIQEIFQLYPCLGCQFRS